MTIDTGGANLLNYVYYPFEFIHRGPKLKPSPNQAVQRTEASGSAHADLHPPDRTVLLFGVAHTKGNLIEKPDELKGGGPFSASLIVTDLAAAFPLPGHSARSGSVALHPFMLADRKVPFVITVSFTGASRDGQGAQNVTDDVRMTEQSSGLWPSEIGLRPPPSTASEYRACTVAAQQEARFSVDLPIGVGIYRVPVLWDATPTRMDLVRALCHENWTAFQQGRALPGLSIAAGQIRTNFTSEIEF